jgi:SpoVK/Ycf46/Vps4 family AAA+-type ATPase
MERPDLAEQLGLEAKRGVLLYGPPGTGKTTIGRALAHRLRSKFFLIDGTVISGTQDFYRKIHRIFEGAKENAPSVLFIDDSDLLFEDSDETGLYRYLLTMLDGLESIENAQVTVILTAMNIGSLPPALIRSGRIELWLLMELPDAAARAAILQDRLQQVTPYLQITDIAPIVERTEGFTGADLKRVVTDAVNLYGYAVANQHEPREPLAYFHEAIGRLAEHREQLESAPSFTGDHHGSASRRRQGYYAAMAALARVNSDTD